VPLAQPPPCGRACRLTVYICCFVFVFVFWPVSHVSFVFCVLYLFWVKPVRVPHTVKFEFGADIPIQLGALRWAVEVASLRLDDRAFEEACRVSPRHHWRRSPPSDAGLQHIGGLLPLDVLARNRAHRSAHRSTALLELCKMNASSGSAVCIIANAVLHVEGQPPRKLPVLAFGARAVTAHMAAKAGRRRTRLDNRASFLMCLSGFRTAFELLVKCCVVASTSYTLRACIVVKVWLTLVAAAGLALASVSYDDISKLELLHTSLRVEVTFSGDYRVAALGASTTCFALVFADIASFDAARRALMERVPRGASAREVAIPATTTTQYVCTGMPSAQAQRSGAHGCVVN
jgi:hypothetical protein